MSQETKKNGGGSGSKAYAKLTVLIVEDTAYMANMLRSILSGLGVKKIVGARTCEDALGSLLINSIDIAIVDELEPPLDGLSVVRSVRTAEQGKLNELPVIYMTTRREQGAIVEARDAGVNEILSKPFSVQQLTDRIDAVLTRPRSLVRSADFTGPDRRRRRDGDAPAMRRESDRQS
ncbi:MAG: response regulator [Parvibaculum sp.]|uniref:response regulator transcription factor n=1 Tax=Parvibaculum sp. TaxID=2024848 RepID=UPI002AB96286|nr:response regulator [Parvibaculum sp.]MDZ4380744.1 response regulator [Parvibaculum sp.]